MSFLKIIAICSVTAVAIALFVTWVHHADRNPCESRGYSGWERLLTEQEIAEKPYATRVWTCTDSGSAMFTVTV
jgi:hypothetical protein